MKSTTGIMEDRLKVLHLITGLGTGGAEVMLDRLVFAMDRNGFENNVVSMTTGGAISQRLVSRGVEVSHLGMKPGVPNPAGWVRLRAVLRRFRPNVMQTWMYHANLLGSFVMRDLAGVSLVWGLHHSNLSPRMNKLQTLLVVRICAALSHRVPEAIVCCSEAARRAHAAIGYDARKLQVIANGYDTAFFRPDDGAGAALRDELGIPRDSSVVSLIARFHPQKNHGCFIEAASVVHGRRPDVHFVLCGEGVNVENPVLAGWIKQSGLAQQFHLLGAVEDVRRVMAGSTVVASSSSGEGMSNVIGEAMACGAVCVVTDVGDSAKVVGNTGAVVPADDPAALGSGLLWALELTPEARRALGAAARWRIDKNFGLSRTTHEYQELYRHVAKSASRARLASRSYDLVPQ